MSAAIPDAPVLTELPAGTPAATHSLPAKLPSAGGPPGTRPVFVARATYRHRRMMDAAALLPIMGALLFALPLLWMGPGGGAARTSHVMIYVFAVWAGLVILSAVVTRKLNAGTAPRSSAGGDDSQDGAEESRHG